MEKNQLYRGRITTIKFSFTLMISRSQHFSTIFCITKNVACMNKLDDGVIGKSAHKKKTEQMLLYKNYEKVK